MPKLFIPSLVLFSLLLVPGTRAEPPAAPTPAGKEKSASLLDELKQGDPAEAVRKLLGEPNDTKPMKAPNGRAEVWVYVKEISRRLDRIDQSTPDVVINVTEADGSVRQKVTPGQVRFQDVHYLTEELTEVLLFNDRYVMHKVSRHERKL